MAMDLDRRTVDIEGDGRHPLATPLGSDAATGQLQHRLSQNLEVRGLSHQRGKARQRRLRRQPRTAQRRQPDRRTGGQAEGLIVAQRIGIIVVAPALRRQQPSRANERAEVMRDVDLA